MPALLAPLLLVGWASQGRAHGGHSLGMATVALFLLGATPVLSVGCSPCAGALGKTCDENGGATQGAVGVGTCASLEATYGCDCSGCLCGPAWSKCPLGSAPARLLRLLRVHLSALGSSALPKRGRVAVRPAAAPGARARRLQSRPFHCLWPSRWPAGTAGTTTRAATTTRATFATTGAAQAAITAVATSPPAHAASVTRVRRARNGRRASQSAHRLYRRRLCARASARGGSLEPGRTATLGLAMRRNR